MKKVIFYAVLVLATLVIFWQQATIRNLSAYVKATETLIDRVYTDNEDYFLDVLTESDDYQNYCESLDRL
jgi:hypothetical protein